MGKKPQRNNGLSKDQYLVQKIINSRISKGKKQFLIKWKGYSSKFNQWVEQSLVRPVALNIKKQVSADQLNKKAVISSPIKQISQKQLQQESSLEQQSNQTKKTFNDPLAKCNKLVRFLQRSQKNMMKVNQNFQIIGRGKINITNFQIQKLGKIIQVSRDLLFGKYPKKLATYYGKKIKEQMVRRSNKKSDKRFTILI